MLISLCCLLQCCCWRNMPSLGTHCLSVTHHLVQHFYRHKGASIVCSLVPGYNSLFYSGRKRGKKTHFLHQTVSCFWLTQTAPCLAVQFTCPTAMRAVFFRAQSTVQWEDRLIYIHVVMVIHKHSGMGHNSNYGIPQVVMDSKRTWSNSLF